MSKSSDSSSDFDWDKEDDATRHANDRQASVEADKNSKMNKKTYKYSPSENSILDCYLKDVKEDVLHDKSAFIEEGKNWVCSKYYAIGEYRLDNEISKWVSSNT